MISAQSVVNLPSLPNDLQQELLFQVLEGINSALTIQGAKLIGGHTTMLLGAAKYLCDTRNFSGLWPGSGL